MATDPSARRDRLLGLLLLLAAVAGGVALARRGDAPPPRPAVGAVVLDEEVAVGSTALVRRLRVTGPARYTVDLSGAPAGTSVAFGPAAPIEEGDAPGSEGATRWSVEPGAAPRTFPVYATGMYVLRAEAPSAGRARLRVTRVAGP